MASDALLAELAGVIGQSGALALASMWGGGRYYVPQEPRAGSPLVVLLGELQARRLAAHYGGSELALPLPPVDEARAAWVRELRAEGFTVSEIAAKVNLTDRSVRRILAP